MTLAATDALVTLACEVTGFDEAAVSRDAMARLAMKLVARDGASAVLAACARRERAVVDECVHACIVNETYVFRQAEHFAFVEQLVAQRMHAAHPAHDAFAAHDAHARPVRAWSAGCATGEEAWSIAATLARALGERAADVRADVLATDLLPANIDVARTGVCRAPRRPPTSVAESGLRARVSDVVDEHGVVRACLRPLVRFAIHDLRAPPPERDFDVVFCRNVLMFLSRDVAAAVLVHLASALAPGGVLVLGPVDTTALALGIAPAGLVPVGPPELSTFALSASRSTASRNTASHNTASPIAPKRAPMPMATVVRDLVEMPSPPRGAARAPNVPAVEAHIRALADLERGDLDGAMRHLVDATRDAPDYVPALVERALLLDRAGDDAGATRAMKDALARLATYADDALVPGPEPLPAAFWSASARAFLQRAARNERPARDEGAR